MRVLRRDGDGYLVELADRTYVADQVVVATGSFQVPRVPVTSSALSADVAQLHSSSYRNPRQIGEGSVPVVGGGSTGYQIADELATSHSVHLSVGSRQKPTPQRLFGRDVFRYLDASGR